MMSPLDESRTIKILMGRETEDGRRKTSGGLSRLPSAVSRLPDPFDEVGGGVVLGVADDRRLTAVGGDDVPFRHGRAGVVGSLRVHVGRELAEDPGRRILF